SVLPSCACDPPIVVRDLLRHVRRREQRAQRAVGIDEKHRSRVIDAVAAALDRSLGGSHAHAQRELVDLRFGAGRADEARIECLHIVGQALGRIALRVDRDHHDLRAELLRQSCELFARRGQRGHRDRADVRTAGEAKEHETPAAAQPGHVERLTVLIDERERRQRSRGREHCRSGNAHLCAGLTLQHPARRQNAGADGYNGDKSCERDRLSSGHRFLVAARIIARLLMNPTSHPPGAAPVTLPAPDPATVEQLIHYGTLLFEQSQLWFGHGTDNAFDEAAELVFFGAGLRHEDAADVYSRQLGAAQRAAILALFERRVAERIPAAYLTHRMWFAGHEFYVDERVLVPRSPLAELVEVQFQPWIAPAKVQRVLDIGTGSSCIAIASALAVPDAQVDASDISNDALAVTAINIARHGVQARVRPIRSDVFAALAGERYDVIVSNPPYVGDAEMATLPPEYGHEPSTGLHCGVDGLDVVRRILSGAAAHLEPHGVL